MHSVMAQAAIWGLSFCCLVGCPSTTSTPVETPTRTNDDDSTSDQTALTGEQLEEVQRTVRIGQDAIIACFEEEMERQKNRKLKGTVTVKVIIGTNGKADDVEITAATLNAPELHQCIKLTVKSWDFPKLPAQAPFTYPFEFSPAY